MRKSATALKKICAAVTVMASVAFCQAQASEDDLTFFRIGTGTTVDSLYGLAVAISSGISSPPESEPCDFDGRCAVPGLIAVAQTKGGSFENLLALRKGEIESALVHADMAYWAYEGKEQYAYAGGMDNLRVIANLTPVSIHVIVSEDSPLQSIKDLSGSRVAVGTRVSGTRANANIILRSYGIAPKDVKSIVMKSGPAMDALEKGKIDAMFMVGGPPITSLTDFAQRHPIRFLSIEGSPLLVIPSRFPFAKVGTLPKDLYEKSNAAQTIHMGVAWVVREDADPVLIENITRALWQGKTQDFYLTRHPNSSFPDPRQGSQFQGSSLP